jgi:flagellar capping protein FliD
MASTSGATSGSSMSTDPSNTTRMAGMMSGLDTEELVKAMASKTLSKIRTRQQKSQTLEWKQEGYQALITKLQDFQSKYLDITSASSVRSSGNLQKMSAVVSDTKLVASAGSSALAGTYKVTKASSAKAATIVSDQKISKGGVNLDLSKTEEGVEYTLKITLDGNMKEVTFTGGDGAEGRLAEGINTAFYGIKNGNHSFEYVDGKLYYDEGEAKDDIDHTFKIGYNTKAGISNDISNIVTTSSTLGSIDFAEELEGDLFRINVNGKDFEFDKKSSIQSVLNAINNNDTGAKASFNSLSGKFTIEAEDTGAGSEVILSQSSGNLLNSIFGVSEEMITSGNSSMSTSVLTYETFGKVGGSLTEEAVADIKNGLEDGKTYGFEIKIGEDTYNISLDESKFASGKTYTNDAIAKEIKKQIESQFDGTDTDAAKLSSELSVTLSDAGALEIRSSKHEVQLSTGGDLKVEGGTATNKTNPVMTGAMNPYGEKGENITVLKEMVFSNGIEGEEKKITGTGEDGMITVADLTKSGYFSLTKDGHLISNLDGYHADENSADAKTFMADFFGNKDLVLENANLDNVLKTDSDIYSKGRNASISVTDPSGASAYYENASNSFNMSGVTFNVEGFENYSASLEDAMTVEVAKDNTSVKDLVVGFIDSYNTLVKDLNAVMTETRPKKNGAYFDPLTEEQKAEFDAEETKNWEEQAKKGLLYNDDTIMRALDDLSNAMLTVSGGMTIFDMGITLSDDRSGGNIFKIDEAKLDAAIAKNGDKIADFFTNAETGLATKMNATFESMVSTSSSKPGYFVQKAGVKDSMYVTNNEISNQLKEYDELIKSLQEKYETETARYWKKFTALETMLAKLNSQAGMFDMTASG